MFSKRPMIKFVTSIVVLIMITSTLPLFVHSAEGALAESSWPKFRGDLRNTGRNEESTQEVSNHTEWTFQTEGIIDSSPAIGTDGTLYIGSYDRKLYAIRSDGSEKWSFQTTSSISSAPAIADDGTIYFGTNGGRFYSLNSDGTENWMISEPFETSIISSPVIREDGSVLIASQDLYSLYPNGTIQWKYSYGEEGRIISTPALDEDGNIYFGYHAVVSELEQWGELIALDPEGNEIWKYDLPDQYLNQILSSPAVGDDGNIYFGSFDYKLYAIDDTGSKLWEYVTDGPIYSSPAIGPDGTIYVGSADNNLYALNPNGTEKWHFETGGEVHSSPAVGPEGMIYFGSYDNHTYSLYPNGTERWRIETGDNVFSSPALGPDGDLYIASVDQKLYALGERTEEVSRVISQLTIPIVIALIFLVALIPKKSK